MQADTNKGKGGREQTETTVTNILTEEKLKTRTDKGKGTQTQTLNRHRVERTKKGENKE